MREPRRRRARGTKGGGRWWIGCNSHPLSARPPPKGSWRIRCICTSPPLRATYVHTWHLHVRDFVGACVRAWLLNDSSGFCADTMTHVCTCALAAAALYSEPRAYRRGILKLNYNLLTTRYLHIYIYLCVYRERRLRRGRFWNFTTRAVYLLGRSELVVVRQEGNTVGERGFGMTRLRDDLWTRSSFSRPSKSGPSGPS